LVGGLLAATLLLIGLVSVPTSTHVYSSGLSIDVSADVIPPSVPEASHGLEVSWKVTGGTPPYEVTIEITGPDGATEVHGVEALEGRRKFDLAYPSGGAVSVDVKAKDSAGSSASAMSSVWLSSALTDSTLADGKLPDLMVESVLISPEAPDVEDEVTIEAVIGNFGSAPAVGVLVAFRVDGQEAGHEIISHMEPSEQEKVSAIWKATALGDHALDIEVDQEEWIAESNEENNLVSVTLKVGIDEDKLEPYSLSSLDTIREWLDAHNKYRCMHGVPPLMWSEELAKSAQARADKCPPIGVPEQFWAYNQGWGPSNWTPKDVVDSWYSEESYYEEHTDEYTEAPNTATSTLYEYLRKYGHFAQVVWKSATKVGCGYSSQYHCWVCKYDTKIIPYQLQLHVLKPNRTESDCAPDGIYYSDSQGKWVSGTTKCWQIDGYPKYDKDAGRDCSACYQYSSEDPVPITACGECPSTLGGRWYKISGGTDTCLGGGGYPPGWTPQGCWRLVWYGLMICPGNSTLPPVRGIRVGQQSACWEQLDKNGNPTGIIFCEY